MNKIIYSSLLIAAPLVLSLTSCDLTRTPKSSLEASQSLSTVADARNWERGMMASFRSMQAGIFQMEQDIQGDQLQSTMKDGNNYSGASNWNTVTAGDYNRQDCYIAYYQSIANINRAFQDIEKIVPEGDEVAELDAIKGNMYFFRAYDYSSLAVRYGMRYNPATADSDLGVELKLTYEPTVLGTRSTNKETYDQIYADLKQAETLLTGEKGAVGSDEITIDAVYSLEARTRLYAQDWSGALNAAKKVINSGTYKLVAPTAQSFKDMWVNDSSSEEILMLFVSRPDETLTINTYFGASTDAVRNENGVKGVNTPAFLPTQDLLDLYEEGDLRFPVFFEKQVVNVDDNLAELYVVAKRKGNPAYAATQNAAFIWWNGYVPNGMHRPKVFRLAELYLIAAEASFRLNDESGAKKYLNDLRASRGLAAVSTSGNALLKDIQDERTRELVFEGFHLWDLRRWGMNMDRDNAQPGTAGMMKPTAEHHFPNSDYRFVWPIPANDVTTNPNLIQNPGW